jgi:signal transduction histidine kinase
MADVPSPNQRSLTQHQLRTGLAVVRGNAMLLQRQLDRSPALSPEERQVIDRRLATIDITVTIIVELLDQMDQMDPSAAVPRPQ